MLLRCLKAELQKCRRSPVWLAFVLLPGDEPETEPQKADLNNIETEPPKRSMGDKIQDLFHQADAAPKKQSRPTFKN